MISSSGIFNSSNFSLQSFHIDYLATHVFTPFNQTFSHLLQQYFDAELVVHLLLFYT